MLKQKILKSSKLLTHEHTGRLREHHHTSYGALLLVLLLASVPVLVIGRASAATSGSASDRVYAVVPAPVPAKPSVILSPLSGTVFSSLSPVTIAGTCPANTLVKIYKNSVMGGATYCSSGRFSIPIDLFVGSNTLIASSYNANSIPGPDSVPVILSLVPSGTNRSPIANNPNSPPIGQFYVTTDTSYIGINPGDLATWPISIEGGQPPYAISVAWGDGQTDLISRQSPGSFNITHVYSQGIYSGTYTLVIKATDLNGNQSFIETEAILGGKTAQAEGIKYASQSSSDFGVTLSAELLAIALSIVLSFWFGEKRKTFIMERDRLNQNEKRDTEY